MPTQIHNVTVSNAMAPPAVISQATPPWDTVQTDVQTVQTTVQGMMSAISSGGVGPSESDLQILASQIRKLSNDTATAKTTSAQYEQLLQQATGALSVVYAAAGYSDINTPPATVAGTISAAMATRGSAGATATAPGTTTTVTTTTPATPVISTTMLVAGLATLLAIGGGIWWFANKKRKAPAAAQEDDEEDDDAEDEEEEVTPPKKYPLPRMATPTRQNRGPRALLPAPVRSRARANPRMLPPGTLPKRRRKR